MSFVSAPNRLRGSPTLTHALFFSRESFDSSSKWFLHPLGRKQGDSQIGHGSTLKSGLARAKFLVAINLSTVRPSGFTKNTGWDDLQLRLEPCGSYTRNYGQVISGQLPGAGSSIRLAAPAGTICTATVTALTLPSLRIRCTSPQPMSVKLCPAV